eukprot:366311-Chlamydomonas_euryale.AAC.18
MATSRQMPPTPVLVYSLSTPAPFTPECVRRPHLTPWLPAHAPPLLLPPTAPPPPRAPEAAPLVRRSGGGCRAAHPPRHQAQRCMTVVGACKREIGGIGIVDKRVIGIEVNSGIGIGKNQGHGDEWNQGRRNGGNRGMRDSGETGALE